MAGKLVDITKGSLVFKEGETSRSLYFLKSGLLKIYKTKISGEQIELGVAHSGEILGELAFFDGEPRSASAEALQDCKIIEIPFPDLEKQIASQPEWLSAMIRSIASRLRIASNKIKQLETSSVTINYAKQKAGLENIHEYFSQKLVSGFIMSLLLSEKNGVVEIAPLKNYYQYCLQENSTKLLELVHFFSDQEILDLSKFQNGSGPLVIKNRDLLNNYLNFLIEENKKEGDERLNLSEVHFLALKMIHNSTKVSNESKIEIHRLIENCKLEERKTIMLEHFSELFVKKLVQKDIEIVSPTEAYVHIDRENLIQKYPVLKIIYHFDAYNLNKTKKARGR